MSDLLVHRTVTNARGFWLVKRTLGWMPKKFLEINRYFTLTSYMYCNTIGQSNNAFSILRFFGGKTKRPCLDLFIHWQIKQTTNTHRDYFSWSYENRSNANYTSLFAVELEKLLVNNKIRASCQAAGKSPGHFLICVAVCRECFRVSLTFFDQKQQKLSSNFYVYSVWWQFSLLEFW